MTQQLSLDLPSLLRRLPSATAPAVQHVSLPKGAAITLRRRQPALFKVLSGQVWLTETPAQGDVVLTSGEAVKLGRTSPWVIEALSDAQFEIHPA